MAPVTTNTVSVTPIIRPALRRLFIPATDAEMEKNTSGTTTQNIMLMNTVPSGRMACATPGSSPPTTHPATMAASITARNRYWRSAGFPSIQIPLFVFCSSIYSGLRVQYAFRSKKLRLADRILSARRSCIFSFYVYKGSLPFISANKLPSGCIQAPAPPTGSAARRTQSRLPQTPPPAQCWPE